MYIEEKSDLFRCFVCHRLVPVEDAIPTMIQGYILPKDICKTCRGKIDKGEPLANPEPVKK